MRSSVQAGGAVSSGAQGPEGRAQPVACLTVTKKVRRAGKARYVHHRKCTTVPVTGKLSIAGTSIAGRAMLKRGGVIYATGTGVRSHGRTRLLLVERRPLVAGRYTLLLRRREGGRWVSQHERVTIGTL